MNKGIILLTSVLLLALFASSCKRKHLCVCDITGTIDTVLKREYEGYTVKEARQLCKSEEYASSELITIKCDIR